MIVMIRIQQQKDVEDKKKHIRNAEMRIGSNHHYRAILLYLPDATRFHEKMLFLKKEENKE